MPHTSIPCRFNVIKVRLATAATTSIDRKALLGFWQIKTIPNCGWRHVWKTCLLCQKVLIWYQKYQLRKLIKNVFFHEFNDFQVGFWKFVLSFTFSFVLVLTYRVDTWKNHWIMDIKSSAPFWSILTCAHFNQAHFSYLVGDV